MILTKRRDDVLVLVHQNEHGRLAGDLAAHWGGARFSAPTPESEFREAVRRHDEGWIGPDEEPLFNHDAHRPQQFTEIPIEDHIPLYERGVRVVQGDDPYAGLLVSMHWTGIYNERWGMQSGNTLAARDRRSSPQADLIAGEEAAWTETTAEIWRRFGTRAEFEANLWHNYELLQALDLLSLYVAVTDLETVTAEAETRDVTAVLTDIEATAGPRKIRSVPTRPAGERVDLTLRLREPGVVEVDPFCFASEVECSLDALRIPGRRYEDRADAADAIREAEQITIGCIMVPPA